MTKTFKLNNSAPLYKFWSVKKTPKIFILLITKQISKLAKSKLSKNVNSNKIYIVKDKTMFLSSYGPAAWFASMILRTEMKVNK